MVNLTYSLVEIKGGSGINPVHKGLLSGDYKYQQYVM